MSSSAPRPHVRTATSGIAVVIAALLLAGCGPGASGTGQPGAAPSGSSPSAPAATPSPPAQSPSPEGEAEPPEGVEGAHTIEGTWSYRGAKGPDHWSELDPTDWAACNAGTRQSPVDIEGATAADEQTLPAIEFSYVPSSLKIFDNGHTVQADFEPGSSISITRSGSAEKVRYDLLQVHFHAESEHEVAGKKSPMEFHFVHRAADGQLAVIGVLVDEGAENAAYAPLTDHMPSTVHHTPEEVAKVAPVPGASLDPAPMLPAQKAFYRYAGSLTTPACSEIVTWLVLTDKIELSMAQLAAFTKRHDGNARAVQPLNGRTIEQSAG